MSVCQLCLACWATALCTAFKFERTFRKHARLKPPNGLSPGQNYNVFSRCEVRPPHWSRQRQNVSAAVCPSADEEAKQQ